MTWIKRIFGVAMFFAMYVVANSQVSKLDSLYQKLNIAKSDSQKVESYRNLYHYFNDKEDCRQYKEIGENVYDLGVKNNNDYWKGFGCRIIADYLNDLQKNEEALKKYLIAINFLEKTTEYLSLSSAYTNLGNVYYYVYGPDAASVYYKKALGILKSHNINDVSSITNLNNNLGTCAASEKNYELAKYYFRNAMDYWVKDKDSLSMASGYNNLANIYRENNQLDSATAYFKKALDLKLKFSSGDGIVDGFINYASVFHLKKDFKKAKDVYLAAEKYADTNSNTSSIRNLYFNTSVCYNELREYKKANEYQTKYSTLLAKYNIELSVLSLSNTGAAYTDSILSAGEKQIADLQIENQNAQLETDKQQKIFLMIGLGIVLIGGILFYNRYKITKKQKEIIEKQKYLVEQQNIEIVYQKDQIEEKQKEIIDSITYANRIQNAVLTNDSVWQKISAQNFVLFKPKDIVSGDFYWAYETPNNKSIWAAADCTGHGVPGAFMSMLGNSLLNEIVIENKIHKASKILNRLRSKIMLALSKENESQNDGMDIGLCVWDKSNNTLEFAGANNNAMIVRDNTLQEIKGDKMPVGNYHGEEKSFTSNEFKLQKNDAIYLYTDGYADQFGGPKGKKFRYKQLDELLLANHAQDMSLQVKLLEQTFLTWKGGLVQTDDICIVGIKVLT